MSAYVLSGAVIFQGAIIGLYDRALFEITLFFILMGYLFSLQNPHSKKLFLHETNAPENLDNQHTSKNKLWFKHRAET